MTTAYYDALCALSEAALDLAAAIDDGEADPQGWNHKQFSAAMTTAEALRVDLTTLKAESLPPPRAVEHPSRPIMGVGERGSRWAA